MSKTPLREDGMILDVWIVTRWSGNPTNLAQDEPNELRRVGLEELPPLPLAHPSYPPFLLDCSGRLLTTEKA